MLRTCPDCHGTGKKGSPELPIGKSIYDASLTDREIRNVRIVYRACSTCKGRGLVRIRWWKKGN